MSKRKLPDEIQVTRRVHQGALKMILRQASIIKENEAQVLDDIAARIQQEHGIEITGADIDKLYDYDPNSKTLIKSDLPTQRYALELAEWIVLEQARMMGERADERVDILYSEVAARLSQDHKVEITAQDLKEDYRIEMSLKGKSTNVLIKRTREKLPDGNK